MDAVPHCPAAGFGDSVATITKRENRRFDIALAAVLGIGLGIIFSAALILVHPAPEIRCASTAVER